VDNGTICPSCSYVFSIEDDIKEIKVKVANLVIEEIKNCQRMRTGKLDNSKWYRQLMIDIKEIEYKHEVKNE